MVIKLSQLHVHEVAVALEQSRADLHRHLDRELGLLQGEGDLMDRAVSQMDGLGAVTTQVLDVLGKDVGILGSLIVCYLLVLFFQGALKLSPGVAYGVAGVLLIITFFARVFPVISIYKTITDHEEEQPS